MKNKKICLSLFLMLILALCANTFVFATETTENVTTTSTTLQSKIDAITDTGAVTLDQNYNESIEIPSGKTIILNLGGYNITASDLDAISNYGNLTIVGTGKISSSETGVAKNYASGLKGGAIVNYSGATAILNGGTFESSNWYAIKNMGNMTINDGCSAVNGTDTSSLIVNGWYDNLANDRGTTYANVEAVMTINGGVFTSGGQTCNIVKNDDGGNLTINGGTFTSNAQTETNDSKAVLQNWHKAVVNNGTFTATSGLVLANGNCNDTKDVGELTINGGTFKGAAEMNILGDNGGASADKGTLIITGGNFEGSLGTTNHNYTIEISGGTYSEEVSESVLKTGYECNLTSTGYVVSSINESESETGSTSESGSGSSTADPTATPTSEPTATTDVATEPNTITFETMPTVDNSDSTTVAIAGVTDPDTAKSILEASLSVNDTLAEKFADKDVIIEVKIENNADISTDVKTKMGTESLKKDPNMKLLDYFNIDIEVSAEGVETENLTTLTKAIKLSVAIPSEVEKVADGYTRTYYIIREHDGTIEFLNTTVAADGKTLTFESDKFSSFALAYVDSR